MEQKINSDMLSSNAKAFVSFNAQGTIEVYHSYNVSSITDYGVGTFGINIVKPLKNNKMPIAGMTKHVEANAGSSINLDTVDSTTTLVRIVTGLEGTGYVKYDFAMNAVVIFGED